MIVTGSDHRFVHKDEENPSSTLADSPNTALKEVEGWLSAYSGFSVKIRPKEYRLVTVRLRLSRVWDLRNPMAKEVLGSVASLITIQSHPDELKDLGREARRAGIQGFVWESTKAADGACLIVFLENVSDEDMEVVEDRLLYERPE